jgi:hypothetical protein
MAGKMLPAVNVTTKLVALGPDKPAGVVTTIRPVVVPGGTTARSDVAVTALSAVVGVPLKLTDVAPRSPEPEIVTVVPVAPVVGVKLVILGKTVKSDPKVVVPPVLVRLIGPLVAALGTVARSCVAETGVTVAATPLNFTDAPVSVLPVIVTSCPAAP